MANQPAASGQNWPRWWRRALVSARRANIFGILEVVSAATLAGMLVWSWVRLSAIPGAWGPRAFGRSGRAADRYADSRHDAAGADRAADCDQAGRQRRAAARPPGVLLFAGRGNADAAGRDLRRHSCSSRASNSGSPTIRAGCWKMPTVWRAAITTRTSAMWAARPSPWPTTCASYLSENSITTPGVSRNSISIRSSGGTSANAQSSRRRRWRVAHRRDRRPGQ